MAPEERAAALRRALDLTQAMRAACRESRWEVLPALEAERGVLLRRAFATPPGESEAASVERHVRRLLELDREILAACEAEKTACAEQMAHLERARRAVSAYEGQMSDLRSQISDGI